MPRKSYKPEEIAAKLRQGDVLTSQGKNVGEAIHSLGVSEVTEAMSKEAPGFRSEGADCR